MRRARQFQCAWDFARLRQWRWLRHDDYYARLNDRAKVFFFSIIVWADANWRFDADAQVLRAGLYRLCGDWVSRRDVRKMLRKCARLGLLKLYTVAGKGYGRLVQYDRRSGSLVAGESPCQLGTSVAADVESACGAAKNPVLSAEEELRE